MNERLVDLAVAANSKTGNEFDLNYQPLDAFLAKFAELVVAECLEIVASSDPERNLPKKRPTTKILGEPYDKIFNRIHKHFGVEESEWFDEDPPC